MVMLRFELVLNKHQSKAVERAVGDETIIPKEEIREEGEGSWDQRENDQES